MGFERYLGPEESAQVAVVNYLRLAYPKVLFHHSPQETYTKSHYQKWKNKALGTIPGCPDLLIFELSVQGLRNSAGLAIEMKHGRNKPTAEQNKFMNELKRCGWRCEVCYDSAEAIEVIDDYFNHQASG